jgi:hypothetical protein
MIDLYLRFADEAAAIAAVPSPDEQLLVDIVGIVSVPTEQRTAEGDQVMRQRRGWHVNIRCTDDRDLSALDPFIVTPEQPARVWA